MPNATVISATEMHKRRGDIIKRCFRDKEHFIVEKDGVPLVAIVPIDEYEKFVKISEGQTLPRS